MSLGSACAECKADVHEAEKHLTCDGCEMPVHGHCSKLSRIDIIFLQSKKRGVKFFCTKCNDTDSQRDLINALRLTVQQLQVEVQSLKTAAVTQAYSSGVGIKEIIAEVNDRQERSRNVVLRNVTETPEGHNDVESVERVLSNALGERVVPCSVFRLGVRPRRDGKPRPLKVTLESTSVARAILRNKQKIKSAGFSVIEDQTVAQRDHLVKLRAELSERSAAGEKDLTIKYVNGVPRVVKF